MNRQKKRVLLILGCLDLIVIVLLGWYAWQLRRPVPTPAAEIETACSQRLLRALPDYLSPTVAWTPQTLNVRMTARYPAPTPPPESAQLLWTTLDALRPLPDVGCSLPEKIVVVITAQGAAQTSGYLFRLHGADVTAWADGDLTEEGLIARGEYLGGDRPTPPAPPPPPSHYSR
jgi:hypothetical protein